MGCCMSMAECHFMIRHDKQNEALKALKELSKNRRLRWASTDIIQNARHLEEAFEEIRFEACFDDFNNINDLDFTGEKLGDETEIFNSIAPFVEDNSYIEMYGEDGDRWRWVFKNGECKWVNPEIKWS